jgi:putative transposase
VRADGRKELVALTDGYRESDESWAGLLRDCKRRGMRAPVLAAGDEALGFWGALREVFPETAEQRCWFHKIGNVLAALPKSARPGAKKALAEIWNADYPAEHWIHLRTTNPIESTFATVRHRAPPCQGHQGPRPGRGRAGNGVQAHRSGTSPLARRERTPISSRSSGPRPAQPYARPEDWPPALTTPAT